MSDRRGAPACCHAVVLMLVSVAAATLSGCGTAPVVPVTARSAASTYTVKAGDTLYSIAKRYGANVVELARLNRLDDQYRIFPGQVLRLSAVRSGSAASGTVSGAAASASSRSNPATPVRPVPSLATAPKFSWPTSGRSAVTTRPNGGEGLVIHGQLGQDIRAAAAGRVVYSGIGLLGYGQLLIIKHDEQWLSAYGHLQRASVTEGSEVLAGQTIATMGAGSTGEAMLYFELRFNGSPVAPLTLLPAK